MINVFVCCPNYEVWMYLFLLSYQIFVIQETYWKQATKENVLSKMLPPSVLTLSADPLWAL